MITIKRKGRDLTVKSHKVSELDKTKCSFKFSSHKFDDDMEVYVKYKDDGTLDLRGKRGEYRIILPDKE